MKLDHLLVAIICVSLLSVYIRVLAGLRKAMDWYICCFQSFLAVHATHTLVVHTYFVYQLQLDDMAPYGLLYGPFLYFAYQVAEDKLPKISWILGHAMPFLVFLICYFLWMSFPSLFRGYQRIFVLSLYGALSVSLLSYALWALFFKSESMETSRSEELRMVSMMAMGLAFIAVIFLVFTFSNVVSGSVRSQFKETIVFLTMLTTAIIFFSYTVRQFAGGADVDKGRSSLKFGMPGSEKGSLKDGTDGRYQKSAIAMDILEAYEASLNKLMEEKPVYLDDALSLASLAQQLKIPKHHLSQVFSLRIGKSFNTYVNELRINHAIKLMHDYPEMNITDIFLRSGFTAKASFNRYFKQFQGCTPTAYRSNIA